MNRIGIGIDVHRFAPNRKLIMGGVHIPYEFGLEGHSDADVLAHAIGKRSHVASVQMVGLFGKKTVIRHAKLTP